MQSNLPPIQKYKLFIFDWDGTLIDSPGSYILWDKLYVQKFYGIDLPLEYFDELAKGMKTVTLGNTENPYFRYMDETYGDGQTSMATIWENIYSLSSDVQGRVVYREGAPAALKLLRAKTGVPIALATNAVMRDIDYFSSQASQTAGLLSPVDFFDEIVTIDHVQHPKPHPEIFQKIISQYAVEPSEVLIFEDSVNGVTAAKAAGADVVAIHAELGAKELADYIMNDWGEMITLLNKDVT